MQTTDLMRPPLNVLIVRIHKTLGWSHILKIQIARNHKHLVTRPSINLEVATNHKIQLLLLVD
jgi:hypothetical protein